MRSKTMTDKFYNMTLLEIYFNVRRDMEKFYRWQDSTKEAYKTNFEKLGSHLNAKPFLEYDLNEFEDALTAIKKEGYYTNNKTVKHTYSEDSIKPLRSNLRKLYDYLVKINVCKASLFWGTEDKINDTMSSDEQKEQEYVKLQKSLLPTTERYIFKHIMNDPEQDGEFFGVALMFGLGLRNAEACGARFTDVVKIDGYDEFYALRVVETVHKNSKTDRRYKKELGGKTKNVFRYVPIPDTLKILIDKRKDYIMSTEWYKKRCAEDDGFNIDMLTIACKGNKFNKICITPDLSTYGKYLLKEAKVSEDVLKFIDSAIKHDDEVIEKEATAYLFRRNFATHLQILGLTQNEIEYIIGHKIESDTEKRNYYTNSDKLFPIKQKMDNRPLFSSQYTSDVEKTLFPGMDETFENPYEQKIRLLKGFGPGEIMIDFAAAAPGTNVEIAIKASSKNPVIKYKVYGTMSKRDRTNRTISVLKTVHQKYASK